MSGFFLLHILNISICSGFEISLYFFWKLASTLSHFSCILPKMDAIPLCSFHIEEDFKNFKWSQYIGSYFFSKKKNFFFFISEELRLTNELKYYHFCSQAELTIDGVDDKEEMGITQVLNFIWFFIALLFRRSSKSAEEKKNWEYISKAWVLLYFLSISFSENYL